MLSVAMLNVILLIVIMLIVDMLSVIILSVLSVVILSVIILRVLSVVMLSVILLSVMSPKNGLKNSFESRNMRPRKSFSYYIQTFLRPRSQPLEKKLIMLNTLAYYRKKLN